MSAIEEANNGRNFSVKEILTDFVLPQLRSIDEKLDKKADLSEVLALRLRLETLEKTFVTRDEKHALEKRIQAGELFDSGRMTESKQVKQLCDDVDSLKVWRNRLAGVTAVLTAAFAPILIAVLERSHW